MPSHRLASRAALLVITLFACTPPPATPSLLDQPAAPPQLLGRFEDDYGNRIDRMSLDGMAPYPWGFCLTAHDAPTAETAAATAAPNRTMPRTGCNGYPFPRLRPIVG